MSYSPVQPSQSSQPSTATDLVTYHHPSGLFSISYPSNNSIIQTQYPSFFPPIGSDNLFDNLRSVYSHCSDHGSRIRAARAQAESWLQSITRMRLPTDEAPSPHSPGTGNLDVQSTMTESTHETNTSIPVSGPPGSSMMGGSGSGGGGGGGGPGGGGPGAGGSSTVATTVSMASCSAGGSDAGGGGTGGQSQKSKSPPTQADMTFQWKLESAKPRSTTASGAFGTTHPFGLEENSQADKPHEQPGADFVGRKTSRAHFKRTLTEEEKVEFKRRRRIGACSDCRKKKKKCTHDPGSEFFDRQALSEASLNKLSIPGGVSPFSSSTERSGSALDTPGRAHPQPVDAEAASASGAEPGSDVMAPPSSASVPGPGCSSASPSVFAATTLAVTSSVSVCTAFAPPVSAPEATDPDDFAVSIELLHQVHQKTLDYMTTRAASEWDDNIDESAWDLQLSRDGPQNVDFAGLGNMPPYPTSAPDPIQDHTASFTAIESSAVPALAAAGGTLSQRENVTAVVGETVPMIAPKELPESMHLDFSLFDSGPFTFFPGSNLALADLSSATATQAGHEGGQLTNSVRAALSAPLLTAPTSALASASDDVISVDPAALLERPSAQLPEVEKVEGPELPAGQPFLPLSSISSVPTVPASRLDWSMTLPAAVQSAPAPTALSAFSASSASVGLSGPPASSDLSAPLTAAGQTAIPFAHAAVPPVPAIPPQKRVKPAQPLYPATDLESPTSRLKRSIPGRSLSTKSAVVPISSAPNSAPPVPSRGFPDGALELLGTVPFGAPASARVPEFPSPEHNLAAGPTSQTDLLLARQIRPPAVVSAGGSSLGVNRLSRAATVASPTGRYAGPLFQPAGASTLRSRPGMAGSPPLSLGSSGPELATSPAFNPAASWRRSQVPLPGAADPPHSTQEVQQSRFSPFVGYPPGGYPVGVNDSEYHDGSSLFPPPSPNVPITPVGRAMRISISRAPEKPRMLSVSSASTPAPSPRDPLAGTTVARDSLYRRPEPESSANRPVSVPTAVPQSSTFTATAHSRFNSQTLQSRPSCNVVPQGQHVTPYAPVAGSVSGPTQIHQPAGMASAIQTQMPPPPPLYQSLVTGISAPTTTIQPPPITTPPMPTTGGPLPFSGPRFRRTIKTTRKQLEEAMAAGSRDFQQSSLDRSNPRSLGSDLEAGPGPAWDLWPADRAVSGKELPPMPKPSPAPTTTTTAQSPAPGDGDSGRQQKASRTGSLMSRLQRALGTLRIGDGKSGGAGGNGRNGNGAGTAGPGTSGSRSVGGLANDQKQQSYSQPSQEQPQESSNTGKETDGDGDKDDVPRQGLWSPVTERGFVSAAQRRDGQMLASQTKREEGGGGSATRADRSANLGDSNGPNGSNRLPLSFPDSDFQSAMELTPSRDPGPSEPRKPSVVDGKGMRNEDDTKTVIRDGLPDISLVAKVKSVERPPKLLLHSRKATATTVIGGATRKGAEAELPAAAAPVVALGPSSALSPSPPRPAGSPAENSGGRQSGRYDSSELSPPWTRSQSLTRSRWRDSVRAILDRDRHRGRGQGQSPGRSLGVQGRRQVSVSGFNAPVANAVACLSGGSSHHRAPSSAATIGAGREMPSSSHSTPPPSLTKSPTTMLTTTKPVPGLNLGPGSAIATSTAPSPSSSPAPALSTRRRRLSTSATANALVDLGMGGPVGVAGRVGPIPTVGSATNTTPLAAKRTAPGPAGGRIDPSGSGTSGGISGSDLMQNMAARFSKLSLKPRGGWGWKDSGGPEQSGSMSRVGGR